MRSLIVIALLCLASTPAWACMYDSDCKTGSMCVQGTCSRDLMSDSNNDTPAPQAPTKGKSCSYDDDCSNGARCVKGSGMKGVCLGR